MFAVNILLNARTCNKVSFCTNVATMNIAISKFCYISDLFKFAFCLKGNVEKTIYLGENNMLNMFELFLSFFFFFFFLESKPSSVG